MDLSPTIKSVQTRLNMLGYSLDVDGVAGPFTWAAVAAAVGAGKVQQQTVIASTFADISDLLAFKICKDTGKSDEECFKVGDNGIGCWQDETAQDHTAMCALPPEVMEQKWGSVEAARHKLVRITYGLQTINCIVADRMPHIEHLQTAARIDLNPAAVKFLNLPEGGMVPVTWS